MTMSTIIDYQQWTIITAVYPEAGKRTDRELNYLVNGLIGEAGELANKFKKLLRGGIVTLDANRRLQLHEHEKQQLLDEAGDVLWYMARIAETLDVDLIDIATANRMKLSDRKAEGSLKDHK